MKKSNAITHLFLDIGGVLLVNGWDHHARKRAATNFNLKWAEIEARHHLIVETYEEGKFTLEDYLNLVIFYKKQPFTGAQFRSFMFAQSKPYLNMIELIRWLKAQFGLKIVAVSNEARELNAPPNPKIQAGLTKEPSMKPANPRILTINGGSSSIKFAVFEVADSLNRILGGSIEQIGLRNTTLYVKGVSQSDNFSRQLRRRTIRRGWTS